MGRLVDGVITKVDEYCMIALSKGRTIRQAYLACPDEILGTLTYQGFTEHWRRVKRMKVEIT